MPLVAHGMNSVTGEKSRASPKAKCRSAIFIFERSPSQNAHRPSAKLPSAEMRLQWNFAQHGILRVLAFNTCGHEDSAI
jgi:hypothetical protein